MAAATAGDQAEAMNEPFIVLPGEAQRHDLGNFEALVLARAEDTADAFTLLQTQSEPPGFGPPLHVHRDAAEAFYVLEGEYLVILDERETVCPPGSFAYVPRNTPHTFKVTSSTPGKKLNLFSPAAMVGFFEELSAAEVGGVATADLLDEIAARHGMGIVGSVPDSYL
jgi:quercetin dioxygenase-like cupin family protein